MFAHISKIINVCSHKLWILGSVKDKCYIWWCCLIQRWKISHNTFSPLIFMKSTIRTFIFNMTVAKTQKMISLLFYNWILFAFKINILKNGESVKTPLHWNYTSRNPMEKLWRAITRLFSPSKCRCQMPIMYALKIISVKLSKKKL